MRLLILLIDLLIQYIFQKNNLTAYFFEKLHCCWNFLHYSTVSIAKPFELRLTSLTTNLSDLKNIYLINQKYSLEITSYDSKNHGKSKSIANSYQDYGTCLN